MAFCSQCGHMCPENAKFCPECAFPVAQTKNSVNERKTKYAGTVFKCPVCGDVLDAFEIKCEACGYERRDVGATSSVEAFADRLQGIDQRRSNSQDTRKNALGANTWVLSGEDEQKITLIRSFAIPNTKEDILEFASMAVTNIDPEAFSWRNYSIANKKELSNAWAAKFEQAYQKGQWMLGDIPELRQLHAQYTEKLKKIKKKKRGIWKTLAIWICIFVFLLALLAAVGESSGSSTGDEGTADIGSQYSIDYYDAESFEKDLNAGVKVNGKIVRFNVAAYKPNSALGINCWSGEHLNFISEKKLDVNKGDFVIGRITEEPSKVLGSWKIPYEVLAIED